MQKKLIALAVASLASSVAFGQSNVTIYGVADIAYEYAQGDNKSGQKKTKFSGINSAGMYGSRIGFKGEEGLGNGIKAIFTMEYGTDIDKDTGGLGYTRQSFVGIDTPIGAFTLGRQYAPSYMYMWQSTAFMMGANAPMSNMANWAGSIGGIGGTMTSDGNTRWDNSVVFQSKAYSGFSSRVIYSFGEKKTNGAPDGANADGAKFGISGNYANGPLSVDLIYQGRLKEADKSAKLRADGTYDLDVNGKVQLSDYRGSTDEWYLGGAYDFKIIKLMATYQQTKSKGGNIQALNPNNANPPYSLNPVADVWSISASIPVSAAGKVLVEYAESSTKFDGDNLGYNRGKDKAKGWALGYTHDLSKRTFLYTSVAMMKNNNNSQIGMSNLIDPDVSIAGEDNWSFVSGISHSF